MYNLLIRSAKISAIFLEVRDCSCFKSPYNKSAYTKKAYSDPIRELKLFLINTKGSITREDNELQTTSSNFLLDDT